LIGDNAAQIEVGFACVIARMDVGGTPVYDLQG